MFGHCPAEESASAYKTSCDSAIYRAFEQLYARHSSAKNARELFQVKSNLSRPYDDPRTIDSRHDSPYRQHLARGLADTDTAGAGLGAWVSLARASPFDAPGVAYPEVAAGVHIESTEGTTGDPCVLTVLGQDLQGVRIERLPLFPADEDMDVDGLLRVEPIYVRSY